MFHLLIDSFVVVYFIFLYKRGTDKKR
jgi:hypothetical protein